MPHKNPPDYVRRINKKTKPPIRRFFIPQGTIGLPVYDHTPPSRPIIPELCVPTPTNDSVPVASPTMGELPPPPGFSSTGAATVPLPVVVADGDSTDNTLADCETDGANTVMVPVVGFLSRWARLVYLSRWAHLPTHRRDIHQSVPGPNIDRQHLAWNFWYIQNHIAYPSWST